MVGANFKFGSNKVVLEVLNRKNLKRGDRVWKCSANSRKRLLVRTDRSYYDSSWLLPLCGENELLLCVKIGHRRDFLEFVILTDPNRFQSVKSKRGDMRSNKCVHQIH